MKIPGPNEVSDEIYECLKAKIIPSLRQGLRICFRDGCPYPKEDTLYVEASEVYQRKLAEDLEEAGWSINYTPETYDEYGQIKL